MVTGLLQVSTLTFVAGSTAYNSGKVETFELLDDWMAGREVQVNV
jgi:hypothetical protein